MSTDHAADPTGDAGHARLVEGSADGVALEPSLNQPDGIHPNAAGVAVIVERITPAVVALIEQARSKESAND